MTQYQEAIAACASRNIDPRDIARAQAAQAERHHVTLTREHVQ